MSRPAKPAAAEKNRPGRKPAAANGKTVHENYVDLHEGEKINFLEAVDRETGKAVRGWASEAKAIYKKEFGAEGGDSGLKSAYKQVTGNEWPERSGEGSTGERSEKKTVNLIKLVDQIKEKGGLEEVNDAMNTLRDLIKSAGDFKQLDKALDAIDNIKKGL